MKPFFDDYLKTMLRNQGLNPDDPRFLDNPLYEKFKRETVICKYGNVPIDFYIRKEWFSDTSINGSRGQFDPQSRGDGRPFKANDLIAEIKAEMIAELAETPWDDVRKYDDENIKNKLFGSSGLREHLRDRVGFNTAPYRKRQKFEEYQLLKILYRIEKHHKKKINITKLLGDLSLENVDRSILGETSVHGHVVTELLTEVHLTIDPEFPVKAKQAMVDLIMPWNDKLLKIASVINLHTPKEIRIAELQRILTEGTSLLKRLDEPQPASENKLLESFYLRVLQLKQIARTHDIDRVTNFVIGSQQTEVLSKQEMCPIEFSAFEIEDAEAFVLQHLDEVAKLVYANETITETQLTFLRTQAKAVPDLLEVFNLQRTGLHLQAMTPLFLISCLQEIALSHSLSKGEDEYEFKNEYYLADGKRRSLTSILKDLTKQIHVEEAYQLVWTTKLERRLYANQGLLEEYLLLIKIGSVCNRMIHKVMQVPDFGTMLLWNKFLLSQIMINDYKPIVFIVERFQQIVMEKTGFSCELHTLRLFSHFSSEAVSVWLTKVIVQKILKIPQATQDDLQLMEFELFGNTYKLGFSIDTAEKRFVLRFFMPEISNEEYELMKKSGLGKFANGHERMG